MSLIHPLQTDVFTRQPHFLRALNVKTIMTVCGIESSFLMVPCCHTHTKKTKNIGCSHPQIKVVCSRTIWGKSNEELGVSFFSSVQILSTAKTATKPHQSVRWFAHCFYCTADVFISSEAFVPVRMLKHHSGEKPGLV